jgi:CDP-paratose synthetase
MRIFLTGATGYFGSHLARELVKRGHELALLKRRTSRLDRIADLVGEVTSHDVEDDPAEFLRSSRPDVVVHSATCYDRRGEGLHAVFQTNVGLPMRLAAAAGEAGVPIFVNTDTTLPRDVNAYSLSKRHLADWLRHMAADGLMRVLNVRLESIFGPGDDETKFPTKLVRALLRDEPRFPITPGNQSRDFIHVEDAAVAFALLTEHAAEQLDSPWIEADVGSGHSVTIREFAELAKRLAGASTQLDFGALPYRHDELMWTRADLTLLSVLGWRGARDLGAALKQTIDQERAGV